MWEVRGQGGGCAGEEAVIRQRTSGLFPSWLRLMLDLIANYTRHHINYTRDQSVQYQETKAKSTKKNTYTSRYRRIEYESSPRRERFYYESVIYTFTYIHNTQRTSSPRRQSIKRQDEVFRRCCHCCRHGWRLRRPCRKRVSRLPPQVCFCALGLWTRS